MNKLGLKIGLTRQNISVALTTTMASFLILFFQNFGEPSGPVQFFGDANVGIFHPRIYSAASSCAGGCDNPAWTSANAIDYNPATAWSSQYHSSPVNSMAWYAVWWEWADTNALRIKPRFINGKPVCLPRTIALYYSIDGNWKFLRDINLPGVGGNGPIIEGIGRNSDGSYDILIGSTVKTNGFLLLGYTFGDDTYGGYYFQLDEALGVYRY